MKKFFKALALVLALALVIGVVPAQATSAKVKAKKTLYVDGAKGTSTDGKLKSAIKSRVAIYKLAGDTKAIAKEHTYKAVIKSGDSVTKTKKYVYAADLGKSVVEIFKDGESLGTSVITVKKNATADTLTITGFEDGQEVVCGVETTVTLPRKGVDSDERRLFVDDKEVTAVEGQPRVYKVAFTKAGDHKVRFEAFQSEELDAVTTPAKEITVKAVMPKPVSAKQVSATKFAATFEGNMEGLITDKDITNQMIYYMIASEPVVTGVVKSVKVEKEVVTVEMYAAFNSNETYYFKYGDADAVSFKTAINKLQYVDKIEIVPAKAYYITKTTSFDYKLFNADGVELDKSAIEVPTFTIDSDVAWFDGDLAVYFYGEGTATIKASLIIGYDEETNVPDEKTATLTITGIKQTAATVASKQYSFDGTLSHEAKTLRLSDTGVLKVKYTYTDGNNSGEIASTDASVYLQSTDETKVVIVNDVITPVQTGSATIVLYSVGEDGTKGTNDDYVVDAFPITILEAQHGKSATATTSQPTLNKGYGSDAASVEVKVVNLDGKAYAGAVTITITQLDNNKTYTGLTLTTGAQTNPETGKYVIPVDVSAAPAADSNKTVRFTVKVTDNANSNAVLTETSLSLVVGNYDVSKANSYKLAASKTALEAGIKNYGDNAYLDSSAIVLNKIYATSGLEFKCGTVNDWTIVNNASEIPVTQSAVATKDYVIVSTPYGTNSPAPYFAETTAGSVFTVKNFTDGTLLETNRAKAGTYSVTGYHVVYNTAATENAVAVQKMTSKSSLGNASVVVSRTDATASVEILNGKAQALGHIMGGDPAAYYTQGITGVDALNKVFKVTIDGLNTTDNAARIQIQPLAAAQYAYDTQTHSIFVKEITVHVALNSGAAIGTQYAVKKVTVGKLFKDE